MVLDNPEDTAQIEIQAFQLGELAVIGLPGEIFVELGLKIKESSPYPYTLINTLCNGSTTGYVCTSEAYAQGGYEPLLKNNNRNPAGAGQLFVDHALRILAQIGDR
jgi:neutral ceramidase